MPNRCESGERTVEYIARRAAVGVRDETDAARIALSSWVVQKPLQVAGDGEHLSVGGSETPAGLSL